jgi:uncharacterized protein YbbK (DUF523 family)
LFFMDRVLVSKCLMGEICRYDARRIESKLQERLNDFEVYPVCPEMEGGLLCPRHKAEIVNGDGNNVLDNLARVIDEKGFDVTANFLNGAQIVLNLALANGIRIAYLREKSPSCGVSLIYRSGSLVCGVGVTTALLKRHGLEVLPVE